MVELFNGFFFSLNKKNRPALAKITLYRIMKLAFG